ncbi:peptidase domain-containing ABC transporter [Symmachiella dynata]|uniref:peptidase domain-containing ABC transporter n=1 Tax=Symmachiella dynata TaxID=2527995 RepID=UPI0011A5FE79|nr:ATP-binding cassette domain-containing protein [Symmachiella dynata]
MMSGDLRAEKIAGGAWILEQFTHSNPVHERNAARRVLSEVMRAWPGDVHRLWWKWFNEAAKSLGLRARTMDCTVEEALALVEDGARLVTYRDEPKSEWLAVLGKSRRRIQMASAAQTVQEKRISVRSLKRSLTSLAKDGKIRCIVLEPQTGEHPVGGAHIAPLDRLRHLMLPEWSDLWIVLVFAFVVGLLMLATPIAIEALVNTVAFGRFLQPVVVLALILFTFLGFLAAVRALQTYVVEIIQRRLFARVAADLAYRLPRVETEATDGHYVPELVNRFFDIVTVQKVAAQLLLDGLGLILTAVIGMAVLAFYHPWLLGFDIVLLASIAFIILVLGRGAIASSVKESKHKYYMAAWLEDIARCPSTFRNDGGTEFALERADRFIHEYLSARKSHFRILMRQILFALGLQAVASTVLLGIGGWLVINGELTLGQLVAAELIVTMIVGAFAKLGKHMESFYDLLASVDKLGVLFDLPIERQSGMLGVGQQGPIDVHVNAVSYAWPGRPAVVDSVSVKIPPATSFGIFGPSNSGKSTLVDLIGGLRSPTAGHLTLDGFDPSDLRPDVFRERVAIVRNNEVFHATIDENVHLHREDVSSNDVRETLQHLGLLEPILELDESRETAMSSSGAPLTENQCRLLTIARAVVGRPGLLLIDGVLDALPDEELELVLDFLLAPEQPWTIIIATGRESLARRCMNRIDLKSQSSPIKS